MRGSDYAELRAFAAVAEAASFSRAAGPLGLSPSALSQTLRALELMAVATPAYLAEHGEPETPADLHRHRCIRFRWPGGGDLYRWEFEGGGQDFDVAVDGPLTVNDTDLMLQAALDGVGIAYLLDRQVRTHIADGRLQRVLQDWSPRFPGFYLYHSSRRQMPPALRAFIDVLRRTVRQAG